jgi:hypothetical protein
MASKATFREASLLLSPVSLMTKANTIVETLVRFPINHLTLLLAPKMFSKACYSVL